MNYHRLMCSMLFLVSLPLYSQLQGLVVGAQDSLEPIVGAKIIFLNAKVGTYTDENGIFEIVLPKKLPDTLVFSAFDYLSDTLIVSKSERFARLKIVLFPDKTLPEVIIEYRRKTKTVSRLNVLAVEELSVNELRKAACCNLSESFETNASVDVNVTDAISGTKTIQMMGLEGVYTQIQFENIPYLRGLEQSFGLSSIPGTWIESIQITKGTGNVVNGYESMAGLVNIEMWKPDKMDAFFLNMYANKYGRTELNAHGSIKVNEKWNTALFVHTSGMWSQSDQNKDGFMDMPMGTLHALNNRWAYRGDKMEAQMGINAYQEDKFGGQLGYRKNDNKKTDYTLYGMQTNTNHLDVYAKTGFFLKNPHQSIGVVYNAKGQQTKALFGKRLFEGEEKRLYINAMFEGIIGNTNNKYKIGLSSVAVDMQQRIEDSIHLNDNRQELVPGAYIEYTYTQPRLTAVFGLRGDYHSMYSYQVVPRLHAKYALSERADWRLTAGKGWRVPNYMIDNLSLMATSKKWIAPATIQPEVSWNFGTSLVQSVQLFGKSSSLTLDYYHTFFEQQLLVDRDENSAFLIFKNLEGKSFSNSIQVELNMTLVTNLDLRIAYKFLDVQAPYANRLRQKTMVSRHRGFVNLAYHTRNNKWSFDLTTSMIGAVRLPGSPANSADEYSEVYPQVSTQITYRHKKWDFYLGTENLTNYQQKNPIIASEDPYGSNFDATTIWAPITGINIYAGIRLQIESKHD